MNPIAPLAVVQFAAGTELAHKYDPNNIMAACATAGSLLLGVQEWLLSSTGAPEIEVNPVISENIERFGFTEINPTIDKSVIFRWALKDIEGGLKTFPYGTRFTSK